MKSSVSMSMNRRKLLGGAAALGAVALVPEAVAGETNNAPSVAAKPRPIVSSPNLNPPEVQVKAGKVRGFRDGKTLTFLGIPYAEAERFELPKPVKPWEGVKSAQAWGPVSPMPAMNMPGGDEFVFPHRYWLENEHCQVINVWTQSTSATAKKPVMVWMHGGGFTNGSSMESYAYDGKNLSEFGDVVVVSLNHRLNIIGTLDLSAYGAEYASSRYTGTADLVAGLEWVQENIAQFGGDPGNVTIFGQSGGGGKVARMMHMPAAKGLFHKVIAQSGGTLTFRQTKPEAAIKTQQAIAAETLKNLKLNGNQIAQLKKVPYRDLIEAGTAALKTVAQTAGRPVNWEVIADDKYVMTEYQDWAASIPYIQGSVYSEQVSNMAKKQLDKNEWSAKQVDEKLTAEFGEKKAEVATEFQKAFPRKKAQDVLYFSAVSRTPLKQSLTWKLEKSKAPVWNYLFAYEYPVNGGVTSFHCSEIAFAFHNVNEPHCRIGTGGAPAALALQDKVAGAWVAFAKTGNPSQPGLEWKPWTPDQPNTLVFDTVSENRLLKDDALIAALNSARKA